MLETVNSIFATHGFRQGEANETARLFLREGENVKKEFYLVDFTTLEKVQSDRVDIIGPSLDLYNRYRNERKDIEKNTSLILFVQVNNIKEDIGSIRNKILKIEEDDFWFKKYVIVYTDQSVPKATDGTLLVENLNRLILDGQKFNQFASDIYFDETYFVIAQLFIKFPFLIVPFQSSSSLNSIDDLLRAKLSNDEFDFRVKIKSLSQQTDGFNWDVLKSECLDPQSSGNYLQHFLDDMRNA